MTVERFLIASLACWRLASLLIYEAGPLDMFTTLRTWARRAPLLDGALACFWCGSVWVALGVTVVALSDGWVILIPFAVSAAAIGVDRSVRDHH